jgi:PEP-CTERM motif
MRMLGALTTKVCYYRNGGCSLGENDWRYEVVGTSAPTVGGKVTKGYIATNSAIYFNSGLGQFSTVMAEGSRFPWTTGHVTLTATGRGPHKTVHYGQGYDNRYLQGADLKGTIQLVTPVLTRWLQPAANWETGGVGILKLEFVPEPHTWMMLAAGISLLGVGYRMRGH